jgi:hypothetical protein
MNIRLVLSGLAAGATLCASPQTSCAKIFPKVFVTNLGGGVAAAASPFGGNGTIDESDDFGQPQLLVQNLAMPTDIAVSDDIIYAVIAGKGIISAFSASDGHLITSDVAAVPKGRPVGIAAFGGNVFVANSRTNSINEYTSSGGAVASISSNINHPSEMTASGGNLFVVNQGGRTGEYITEYNAANGQQVDGKLVQGLHGPIQIAVSGTDLFVTHISAGTIDEYDVTSGLLLKSGFITGLHGPTDIATFNTELFVTDVPNHSIDVYDIATGKQLTALTINGLHGRPQGIDIVPGGTVPDSTATWLLLLIGLAAVFAPRLTVRHPA